MARPKEGESLPHGFATAEEAKAHAEAERAKRNTPWVDLVKTITQAAKDLGTSVDLVTWDWMIPTEGEDDPQYGIRVNPGIANENGDPIVVSVDLYEEGVHIQQVLSLVEWRGREPCRVKTDRRMYERSNRRFTLTQLAKHAKDAVGPRTEIRASTIFPTPEPTRTDH